MVSRCPRLLVIDVGAVVVLVCTWLGFVISSFLQPEGEINKFKKIFKHISLNARFLVSHLALERQASVPEGVEAGPLRLL